MNEIPAIALAHQGITVRNNTPHIDPLCSPPYITHPGGHSPQLLAVLPSNSCVRGFQKQSFHPPASFFSSSMAMSPVDSQARAAFITTLNKRDETDECEWTL